ncbi:hypothetical protein [Chitinophaga sp.]|uniref:hypothetical protein n=1 Tax=Chitinophaga sp. TaxID=1869181 RepID=UPI002F929B1B
MKRWLLIGCMLTVSVTRLSAQAGAALLSKGADGNPVFEKSYTDVQGSPYLQEDWAIGSVVLKSDKSYTGVALKYDQVKDELLFRNEKNEMNTFVQPVKSFNINSRKDNSQLVFRNGFAPAKGATESSYYQVLADGKVQLLFRNVKKVRKDKAYNSATTVLTIEEYPNYFIAKNGVPVSIKKNEKAVLEAIGGDSAALTAYIRSNKLNVKNDEDLVKLIVYCNSLTPEGK